MQVNQIYQLVNQAFLETTGQSSILTEDLSNVVDFGAEVFKLKNVDNFVHALYDQIGRIVFVDRKYTGMAPDVMRTGWEYGSILEKVRMDLPEADVNESWELTPGASYDPNVFNAPNIHVKLYNSMTTYEIDISISERQLKEAFRGPEQLNRFVSMIYTVIGNKIRHDNDTLIMRMIGAMIARSVIADYGTTGVYTGVGGTRAINILARYNAEAGTSLTVEQAKRDKDFLTYASYYMMLYTDKMKPMTTLFNVDGRVDFTPSEDQHVVLLSDFVRAADFYLQSSTFHDLYTALPRGTTVPYWQGTGVDYGFNSVSSINVSEDAGSVNLSGIIGVIFDRDAIAVCNQNERVLSHFNPKAEFYNNFYKMDVRYMAGTDEQFVVFFMA